MTTVIVNGNRVLRDLPVWSLCSWRADEVELLELGRDVCAEVTRSIADLLGISCGPRTRNAREGLGSPTASRLAGRSRSYVVIWEKK